MINEDKQRIKDNLVFITMFCFLAAAPYAFTYAVVKIADKQRKELDAIVDAKIDKELASITAENESDFFQRVIKSSPEDRKAQALKIITHPQFGTDTKVGEALASRLSSLARPERDDSLTKQKTPDR